MTTARIAAWGTAWAHLPNAALIDAVIADAKSRPDVWKDVWKDVCRAAWGTAWGTAWDTAWFASVAAVQGAERTAARSAARIATRTAARTGARGAVNALIAWDDCAPLLALPSTTLRTMADLCDAPVCHQAVLLLPYVLVKEAGQ